MVTCRVKFGDKVLALLRDCRPEAWPTRGLAHHEEPPGFSQQVSSRSGIPPLFVASFIPFLEHTVATMTSDHILVTVTFDTIIAFDSPLVAVLTSSPVMWRKERLWNFGVLYPETKLCVSHTSRACGKKQKQTHVLSCERTTLSTQEMRQRATKYCRSEVVFVLWTVCASLSAAPPSPLIPTVSSWFVPLRCVYLELVITDNYLLSKTHFLDINLRHLARDETQLQVFRHMPMNLKIS
jgi:hypothetical protein